MIWPTIEKDVLHEEIFDIANIIFQDFFSVLPRKMETDDYGAAGNFWETTERVEKIMATLHPGTTTFHLALALKNKWCQFGKLYPKKDSKKTRVKEVGTIHLSKKTKVKQGSKTYRRLQQKFKKMRRRRAEKVGKRHTLDLTAEVIFLIIIFGTAVMTKVVVWCLS